MQHPAGVRGAERLQQGTQYLAGHRRPAVAARARVLRDVFENVVLEPFHGDVMLTSRLIVAGGDQADDVRVSKRRQRLTLPQEALLAQLVVEGCAVVELDGDKRARVLVVAG